MTTELKAASRSKGYKIMRGVKLYSDNMFCMLSTGSAARWFRGAKWKTVYCLVGFVFTRHH